MFGRKKVAALVAEFLGTAVLASAVLAMAGRTSFPFFAAVAAGLTVGLMTMTIGAVSGAHLNPVITLGLWTVRKIETTTALVYVAAQALGGVAAWQLNEYLLNQPIRNTAGEVFQWRVLVAEAVGAFVLTTVLAAAVYRRQEGSRLAFAAGAGLTLGIITASIASNGIVNPAVAVGIQSWSWAYAIGPLVGAVVGMNLYGLLFAPLDQPVGAVARVKAAATKVTRTVKKTARKTTKRK